MNNNFYLSIALLVAIAFFCPVLAFFIFISALLASSWIIFRFSKIHDDEKKFTESNDPQ